MGGDDFAYFSQVMPALMMRIGTKAEEEGYVHPLHSSKFNFNEDVLVLAVGVFLCLISAGCDFYLQDITGFFRTGIR
jgi:metal-dependent amidase/aminoacylase/carboxypeptidase family protein